mmetsp:Transcript_10419/g.10017  ORF Transcript_10419/g.10017 Transcript_10419/m.10017 type:complete len:86 (+) Transcript_10419:36-293(+)
MAYSKMQRPGLPIYLRRNHLTVYISPENRILNTVGTRDIVDDEVIETEHITLNVKQTAYKITSIDLDRDWTNIVTSHVIFFKMQN